VRSWLAEESDYNGKKFGEGNAVKYGHFSKHPSSIVTFTLGI
jgi:hypothetical protein